jgi:hypothetical protein
VFVTLSQIVGVPLHAARTSVLGQARRDGSGEANRASVNRRQSTAGGVGKEIGAQAVGRAFIN